MLSTIARLAARGYVGALLDGADPSVLGGSAASFSTGRGGIGRGRKRLTLVSPGRYGLESTRASP